MRMTDLSIDIKQSAILCVLVLIEKGLAWRSSMGLSSELWAPINPIVDTSPPVPKLSAWNQTQVMAHYMASSGVSTND